MPRIRSKDRSTMHIQRLSPSPPLACAGAVCLLIFTTTFVSSSRHRLISPVLCFVSRPRSPSIPQGGFPYMAHESHASDTLFIIAEPDHRFMAGIERGISAACAHCQATHQSCLLDAGSASHCLRAQGWFKSPAKGKNWSCTTCATGYWVGPDEHLVKCHHVETLRTRIRAKIVQEPEAPVETPEAVFREIAQELELTGNRLVRLAARLRDVSAQRPSTYVDARCRPRPERPRLIEPPPQVISREVIPRGAAGSSG